MDEPPLLRNMPKKPTTPTGKSKKPKRLLSPDAAVDSSPKKRKLPILFPNEGTSHHSPKKIINSINDIDDLKSIDANEIGIKESLDISGNSPTLHEVSFDEIYDFLDDKDDALNKKLNKRTIKSKTFENCLTNNEMEEFIGSDKDCTSAVVVPSYKKRSKKSNKTNTPIEPNIVQELINEVDTKHEIKPNKIRLKRSKSESAIRSIQMENISQLTIENIMKHDEGFNNKSKTDKILCNSVLKPPDILSEKQKQTSTEQSFKNKLYPSSTSTALNDNFLNNKRRRRSDHNFKIDDMKLNNNSLTDAQVVSTTKLAAENEEENTCIVIGEVTKTDASKKRRKLRSSVENLKTDFIFNDGIGTEFMNSQARRVLRSEVETSIINSDKKVNAKKPNKKMNRSRSSIKNSILPNRTRIELQNYVKKHPELANLNLEPYILIKNNSQFLNKKQSNTATNNDVALNLNKHDTDAATTDIKSEKDDFYSLSPAFSENYLTTEIAELKVEELSSSDISELFESMRDCHVHLEKICMEAQNVDHSNEATKKVIPNCTCKGATHAMSISSQRNVIDTKVSSDVIKLEDVPTSPHLHCKITLTDQMHDTIAAATVHKLQGPVILSENSNDSVIFVENTCDTFIVPETVVETEHEIHYDLTTSNNSKPKEIETSTSIETKSPRKKRASSKFAKELINNTIDDVIKLYCNSPENQEPKETTNVHLEEIIEEVVVTTEVKQSIFVKEEHHLKSPKRENHQQNMISLLDSNLHNYAQKESKKLEDVLPPPLPQIESSHKIENKIDNSAKKDVATKKIILNKEKLNVKIPEKKPYYKIKPIKNLPSDIIKKPTKRETISDLNKSKILIKHPKLLGDKTTMSTNRRLSSDPNVSKIQIKSSENNKTIQKVISKIHIKSPEKHEPDDKVKKTVIQRIHFEANVAASSESVKTTAMLSPTDLRQLISEKRTLGGAKRLSDLQNKHKNLVNSKKLILSNPLINPEEKLPESPSSLRTFQMSPVNRAFVEMKQSQPSNQVQIMNKTIKSPEIKINVMGKTLVRSSLEPLVDNMEISAAVTKKLNKIYNDRLQEKTIELHSNETKKFDETTVEPLQVIIQNDRSFQQSQENENENLCESSENSSQDVTVTPKDMNAETFVFAKPKHTFKFIEKCDVKRPPTRQPGKITLNRPKLEPPILRPPTTHLKVPTRFNQREFSRKPIDDDVISILADTTGLESVCDVNSVKNYDSECEDDDNETDNFMENERYSNVEEWLLKTEESTTTTTTTTTTTDQPVKVYNSEIPVARVNPGIQRTNSEEQKSIKSNESTNTDERINIKLNAEVATKPSSHPLLAFKNICHNKLKHDACTRYKCNYMHTLPNNWQMKLRCLPVESLMRTYDYVKRHNMFTLYKAMFSLVAGQLGAHKDFNNLTSLVKDVLEINANTDREPLIKDIIQALIDTGFTFYSTVEIVFRSANVEQKLKNLLCDILLNLTVEKKQLEDNWPIIQMLSMHKHFDIDKGIVQVIIIEALAKTYLQKEILVKVYNDLIKKLPETNMLTISATLLQKFVEMLRKHNLQSDADDLYSHCISLNILEKPMLTQPEETRNSPKNNVTTAQVAPIEVTVASPINPDMFKYPPPALPNRTPNPHPLNNRNVPNHRPTYKQNPKNHPWLPGLKVDKHLLNQQNYSLFARSSQQEHFNQQHSSVYIPPLMNFDCLPPQKPNDHNLPGVLHKTPEPVPVVPLYNNIPNMFDRSFLDCSTENLDLLANTATQTQKEEISNDIQEKLTTTTAPPIKTYNTLNFSASAAVENQKKTSIVVEKLPYDDESYAALKPNMGNVFNSAKYLYTEVKQVIAEENFVAIMQLILKHKEGSLTDIFLTTLIEALLETAHNYPTFFKTLSEMSAITNDISLNFMLKTIGVNLVVYLCQNVQYEPAYILNNILTSKYKHDDFYDIYNCKMYINEKYSYFKRILIIAQMYIIKDDIPSAWTMLRDNALRCSSYWQNDHDEAELKYKDFVLGELFKSLTKVKYWSIALSVIHHLMKNNSTDINIIDYADKILVNAINNKCSFDKIIEFINASPNWYTIIKKSTFRAIVITAYTNHKKYAQSLYQIGCKLCVYPQLLGNERIITLSVHYNYAEIQLILDTFLENMLNFMPLQNSIIIKLSTNGAITELCDDGIPILMHQYNLTPSVLATRITNILQNNMKPPITVLNRNSVLYLEPEQLNTHLLCRLQYKLQ